MRQTFIAICILIAAVPAIAQTSAIVEEIPVGPEARDGLSLTVYANGLALVRDRRQAALPSGEHRVAFEGVATKLIPASARVKGPGLTVLERDFEFDVISPSTLLARAEGKEVNVVTVDPETGRETVRRGRVLSVEGGRPVVMIDGRVWSSPPGTLVYDGLPAGVRPRPTLLATVRSADGAGSVDLAYLTAGLSWQADYTVVLDPDADRLDLEGWATVTNASGTDYPQAELQLVAGSVQRTRVPQPRAMKMERAMTAAAPMADQAMPARESLAAFHLYDLGRQVSLKRNQSKQVALLAASDVAMARQLLMRGSAPVYGMQRGRIGPLHPTARVKFKNWKDNPGVPLPAGTARMYQKDSQGRLQFVGEDRVPDTAEGAEVTLTLGRAFDVTVHRGQTAFEWLDRKNRRSDSAHRIVLANGGDKPAEVRLEESLPGDWTITQESRRHSREANQAVWTLTVPAKGETVLTYRVRIGN